tara:strand:- start:574 stop:798 length:225 start_codon:yes stop_codon:yes gene_type:complete
MSYIKVKDNENFVRDSKSNCIINRNKSEYDEYLARRKSKQSEKNKVENLEKDLSIMKSELDEIKNLLRSLVNGN